MSNQIGVVCVCGWRGKRTPRECNCYETPCTWNCVLGTCPRCSAPLHDSVKTSQSKRIAREMATGVEIARLTRYRCIHCHRSWSDRRSATKHAAHCFKNPQRKPYVGELTSLNFTGRWTAACSCAACGDSNPPEFVEHETMPAWWPGEGKIWDGAAWRDVPGYVAALGAEEWPSLGGMPLPEVKPAEARLGVFDAASAPDFAPRA